MGRHDRIKPISYLKAHSADLIRELGEGAPPLIITQNGEARAVLQDVGSWEATQEALALLKLLALGREEIARGDIAHRVEKGGVQPVLVERKHEAAPAAGKEHDFVEFGAGQARDGGQPVGDRDDRASLLGRRAETGGFDARP